MKCALIVNPAAGRGDPRELVRRLRRQLEGAGHSVDLTVTTGRGDAEIAARAAATERLGCILSVGGDGTLNEVVNGSLDAAVPLCVLPCGTVNVVALELGIPLVPDQACALVECGVRRRIDVGVANGRAFVLACGAGYDAATITRTSRALKRRSGRLAYLVAGLRTIVRVRPWLIRCTIDGVEVAAPLYQALACNTTRYAGHFRLSPFGAIDDGLLDAYLFHAHGRIALARCLLSILMRRMPDARDVERIAARSVECTATPVAPTQLDGDSFARTPLTAHVRPGALTILGPPDGASYS